jgi:hypothetical protein
MRKEILIAIVAGVVFGLVIAFGVWRANSALEPSEEIAQEKVEVSDEVAELEENSKFMVTLVSPNENDVVVETPATFSGITKVGSWVVISAEEEDYIIETDKKGAFEQEVDLIGGINQIILQAFDESGASVKKELTIVFSTEFEKQQDIDREETSESTSSAETEATDTVREKVKEKIKEAQDNPKAFIGTVTDITEKTLQIKNESEEIQQISFDPEDTSFVKSGEKTSSIDFEDIGIGDFIVAMGYITNGNGVLETKRVLVLPAPEELKRTVVLGEIASIEKKNVSISSVEQGEVVLGFPKRWDGPEISELEEGMKIIVAGEVEEEKLIVRTIKIVSTSEPSPTPEETEE